MAHHKKHTRSHKKRMTKNIVNKTINTSVSLAKSTSKKIMPKVKSGLENVGSKVITTTSNSVPFLQRMTRKFFGLFSKNKSRKNRK